VAGEKGPDRRVREVKELKATCDLFVYPQQGRIASGGERYSPKIREIKAGFSMICTS
jgi:hypothetical protein